MAEIDILNAIAALDAKVSAVAARAPVLDALSLSATNYCTNPSFETHSDSDGIADGLSIDGNVAGTPTFSRVAAIVGSGSYAQRIEYTGVATDTQASVGLSFTIAGEFLAGDPCTVSVWAQGIASGCSVSLVVLNQVGGAAFASGLSVSAEIAGAALSTAPFPLSVGGIIAVGCTSLMCCLRGSYIDNGNTFDVAFDDVQVEKSLVPSPYFDGDGPGHYWTGTRHASTSVRPAGALTDALSSIASVAGVGRPLIVAEGDSMTAPSTHGTDWPTQMSRLAGHYWEVINVAVGGEFMESFVGEASTEVDPRYDSSRPSICVIWGGQNDCSLDYWTAQSIWDNLHNYCEARKAVGFKTVVCSLLAREGDTDVPGHTYAAHRNAANALLDADHHFADAYVDLAANEFIGGDHASLDTTYFSDAGGIHLNVTGKTIVAGLVKTAIDGLIGAGAPASNEDIKAIRLKTDTIGGPGAIPWPYTLNTPDGTPIPDVEVWVTTDGAGNNVVTSGRTDDFGALVPVPKLDAGTYYFWAKKSGVNFSSPDIEVVA